TARYASQLPLDTRFETLWTIEQKNFEGIYNLTRQAHVPLIFISHNPMKEDTREYVKEQLRRFCFDHAIPLFEYFRSPTDQPTMYRVTAIIQQFIIKNWSASFLTNDSINSS